MELVNGGDLDAALGLLNGPGVDANGALTRLGTTPAKHRYCGHLWSLLLTFKAVFGIQTAADQSTNLIRTLVLSFVPSAGITSLRTKLGDVLDGKQGPSLFSSISSQASETEHNPFFQPVVLFDGCWHIGSLGNATIV